MFDTPRSGRPTRRLTQLVFALLASLTTMPPVAAAAAQWQVVDLGIAGGTAFAINDRGHIAGEVSYEPGNSRAFLWRGGEITYFGSPGDRYMPTDMNNRDEIVGLHVAGSGFVSGFLWRGGVATDLPISYASGINDRGEVVGSGFGAQPVVWRDGVTTELRGLPGGLFTFANDINNAGVVVGQSGGMVDSVAVQWRTPDAEAEPLTSVPSTARAISDSGRVAGLHWSSGFPYSFLWFRGQFTDITPPPGSQMFQAYSINNQAQVVGDNGFAAVVWQRGNTTVLPSLTENDGATASDINNRGQITGVSGSRAVLWRR